MCYICYNCYNRVRHIPCVSLAYPKRISGCAEVQQISGISILPTDCWLFINWPMARWLFSSALPLSHILFTPPLLIPPTHYSTSPTILILMLTMFLFTCFFHKRNMLYYTHTFSITHTLCPPCSLFPHFSNKRNML